MKIDLQEAVETFVDKWSPEQPRKYAKFLVDLRALLELYARAALLHGSLPDTEHEHGEPV